MSNDALSLPLARLTEISQALAELTNTSFSGSAIAARAVAPSFLSPLSHHSSALVSSNSLIPSVEGFVEAFRERIEAGLDLDLPSEHSGLPRFRCRLIPDQLRDGLPVVFDNDLAPGLGLLHEFREGRLRLVNPHDQPLHLVTPIPTSSSRILADAPVGARAAGREC